jgi:hypothetical protein
MIMLESNYQVGYIVSTNRLYGVAVSRMLCFRSAHRQNKSSRRREGMIILDLTCLEEC